MAGGSVATGDLKSPPGVSLRCGGVGAVTWRRFGAGEGTTSFVDGAKVPPCFLTKGGLNFNEPSPGLEADLRVGCGGIRLSEYLLPIS